MDCPNFPCPNKKFRKYSRRPRRISHIIEFSIIFLINCHGIFLYGCNRFEMRFWKHLWRSAPEIDQMRYASGKKSIHGVRFFLICQRKFRLLMSIMFYWTLFYIYMQKNTRSWHINWYIKRNPGPAQRAVHARRIPLHKEISPNIFWKSVIFRKLMSHRVGASL